MSEPEKTSKSELQKPVTSKMTKPARNAKTVDAPVEPKQQPLRKVTE